MKTSSPLLLPIFKSRSLALLLAHLLTDSSKRRPQSIGELATRLDVSPSTVQRDVAQLERAGILRTETVGSSRLVAVDEASPYVTDLRSLVTKAFGPRPILADLLADIPGVDEAYIFGSWAARYLGQPGPAPEDVDVLVIGDPSPTDIDRATRHASQILDRDVQPIIVSPDEWAGASTGFLQTLRTRALVPLYENVIPPASATAPRNVRHVMPDGRGGWRVVTEGHRRASAVVPTKREAVARAKELVRRRGGGEVVVHRGEDDVGAVSRVRGQA